MDTLLTCFTFLKESSDSQDFSFISFWLLPRKQSVIQKGETSQNDTNLLRNLLNIIGSNV